MQKQGNMVICLVIWILSIQGAITQLQDQLLRDLFASYESGIMPQCEINDIVNATAELSLRQIIDLDEPKQILKLNVWVRMHWSDCRLTWNPANYSSIGHIIVPYDQLWVPDLVLYDNAESELAGIKNYRANLKSTGEISYNFPTILNSLCAIDVKYFPFDTQTCPLIFGSWAYNGLQLDVSNSSDHTTLESFVRSIEWDVLDTPVSQSKDLYDGIPFSSVNFTFKIRRKPLFYIMNILCPCLLITFVAVFGFMLPPDSGEKVNLEITVLLSLAVFQLIVLETIPPSGESTPFLGIYFMVSMTLVGVSCLLTVFVLQVHYKGNNGTRMPLWVKRYVMPPLSRITFVKIDDMSRSESHCHKADVVIPNGPKQFENEKVTYCLQEEEMKTGSSVPTNDGKRWQYPLHNVLNSISEKLGHFQAYVENQYEDEHVEKDWSQLAVMMDRVFMVIYVTVVTTVALCLILPVVLRF